MSPPRRPGTPGSPVLPLLGTAAGTGPGGRRGLLPYALLLLAGFLLVNLFSSGAARGGGGDGGGPLGWGNGSSWNASSDEVLSLGLQLEPPASAGCDCSGTSWVQSTTAVCLPLGGKLTPSPLAHD